jgi:hypothetical protein
MTGPLRSWLWHMRAVAADELVHASLSLCILVAWSMPWLFVAWGRECLRHGIRYEQDSPSALRTGRGWQHRRLRSTPPMLGTRQESPLLAPGTPELSQGPAVSAGSYHIFQLRRKPAHTVPSNVVGTQHMLERADNLPSWQNPSIPCENIQPPTRPGQAIDISQFLDSSEVPGESSIAS